MQTQTTSNSSPKTEYHAPRIQQESTTNNNGVDGQPTGEEKIPQIKFNGEAQDDQIQPLQHTNKPKTNIPTHYMCKTHP